jgi:hypothetical protein
MIRIAKPRSAPSPSKLRADPTMTRFPQRSKTPISPVQSPPCHPRLQCAMSANRIGSTPPVHRSSRKKPTLVEAAGRSCVCSRMRPRPPPMKADKQGSTGPLYFDQVTRISSIRRIAECPCTFGEALDKRSDGSRPTRAARPSSSSAFERASPMHRWAPPPNIGCSLGWSVRYMLKVSGRS